MMNLKRLLSCVTMCVATIMLVVMIWKVSYAQDQTEEAPKQSSGQEDIVVSGGGFGFGFGGGGGSGGGGVFPSHAMGGSPAIAAQGNYVFVVHNNKLYQFAAEDLAAIKNVQLEASE